MSLRMREQNEGQTKAETKHRRYRAAPKRAPDRAGELVIGAA